MIAVMVMGTGIAGTGVMNSFSRLIVRVAPALFLLAYSLFRRGRDSQSEKPNEQKILIDTRHPSFVPDTRNLI